MNSLFIINGQGDIIIERHWRGRISRTVGEKFYEEVKKEKKPEDVLPVISFSNYTLVHVYRYGIFFVGVVEQETQPLLVIELLNNLVETMKSYITTISDDSIKRHFVTIYQLLDEMIDNGFPITTELSMLYDLVKPVETGLIPLSNKPTIKKDPTSKMASLPWRKVGIYYSSNEIKFDCVENLNFVVDVNGMTTLSEIYGTIECTCNLSGMPDVQLYFRDPNIIDDISFHHCIRYARYEQDKVISFIPPDGKFELLSYRISKVPLLPIYVRPQFNISSGGFYVTIMTNVKGAEVDDVRIIVPLPENAQSSKVTANVGNVEFNANAKQLVWSVGKFTPKMTTVPMAKGEVILASKSITPTMPAAVYLKFRIPSEKIAFSGLQVDKVDVLGEKYKPFKGVRYVTKAGTCEVRTV